MKKERIRKADGRYLIYYTFEQAELSPEKKQWQRKVRRYTKRNAKRGAQGWGR